jgi:hypothetical protein
MSEELQKLILTDCTKLGLKIKFGIKEYFINEPGHLGFGNKLLVIFESEEDLNYYKLTGEMADLADKEMILAVENPGIDNTFNV